MSGKVSRHPDTTWDTTVALGLDDAFCRRLDFKLPKIFFKKPVLGFFLLWLLAYLGLGPTWEDSSPEPQRKNIETFERGLAPFHHIARPDEGEERALIKRAKAGDVIARNTIIAGHLWVAEDVAKELWVADSDVDDLKQEAALALFRALDDFDPDSGTRFSTFAYDSVRGDVKDWLRKSGRWKRHASTEMIAERNEAALGLYASSSKKPTTEFKIFRELFGKT